MARCDTRPDTRCCRLVQWSNDDDLRRSCSRKPTSSRANQQASTETRHNSFIRLTRMSKKSSSVASHFSSSLVSRPAALRALMRVCVTRIRAVHAPIFFQYLGAAPNVVIGDIAPSPHLHYRLVFLTFWKRRQSSCPRRCSRTSRRVPRSSVANSGILAPLRDEGAGRIELAVFGRVAGVNLHVVIGPAGTSKCSGNVPETSPSWRARLGYRAATILAWLLAENADFGISTAIEHRRGRRRP